MKIIFILFLCHFGQLRADWRGDVIEKLELLSDRSNLDFAHEVYEFLEQDYPTSDWLVVAYNPILGSDNHQVYQCNGLHRFRRNGRNIVVAAVPRSRPRMNLSIKRRRMRSMQTTYQRISSLCPRRPCPRFERFLTSNLGAETIFDSFPYAWRIHCNNGALGVIKRNANVQMEAKNGRLAVVTNGAYKLYVFG